ncbi:asparagine synthase-related protein [Nannocystis pusilla]|uniref:asparagine synthase-related protein n=1 Tax=Nannocystis pusilla TaxID=889268 RepID=UPI003B7E3952
MTIARWWDCEPRPPDPRLQSVEAWAEAVAPTLAEAIELHTVSDVPVGAFLSGGLDSSTIVAALARRGSALQTFCVGYGPEGRATRSGTTRARWPGTSDCSTTSSS